MAFHVACPITCQRICFCTLGFPQKLQSEKGRKDFLEEVFRVEEFLNDPWSVRARQKGTVQVLVPRIVASTPVLTAVADAVGVGVGAGAGVGVGVGGGDADVEEMSAQTKRVALQKKAVAASLAAEDYARRFETGDLADASKETGQDIVAEEQGASTVNVMCRLCFYGENEGSERAMRMLACKICSKKYHRNCLKSWAQHRDIFHWSSWACPSCRTCEICRRTGDPNKFMFCKRCDGAYHCYCQQPPHKNVSAGPYLCPKHTRCHSCGSNVSGSGLSTRWFLGYTCCDACGRLFVKGKYCPVCLKVYRDSESTPMVCCDVCQRWVHCDCDGISDEKYLQFQADNNLYYKCAACRGDCYQLKDLDDAVQELWRRRDEADRDLIASLRAAAGLPSQEEIFSISLYSDDEENGPVGRSLKFSVKGLADKTPKNNKEYGKKSLNRKYVKKKGSQASSISKTEAHQSFERQQDTQSFDYDLDDEKTDQMQSQRSGGPDVSASPLPGVPFNTKRKLSISQPGIMRSNLTDEVVNNEERASRVIQIKSSKSHGSDVMEGTVKQVSKSETVKGTKLVIHLGSRNRNVSNSPRSEASSCHKEQELPTASNGSEDTSQLKASDKKYIVDGHDGFSRRGDSKGGKLDTPDELKGSKHRGRDGSLIKLGKVKSDVPDLKPIAGGVKTADGYESTGTIRTRVLLGKRSTEGRIAAVEPVTDAITLRGDVDHVVPARKQSKGTPNRRDESQNVSAVTSTVSDSFPKDPKPLLKLKFKNPYSENRSSWAPKGEEEKNSVKGQRSKRKRPSPLMDKGSIREDADMSFHRDSSINEAMDANWILKKLGKDAIGKRVEVHQPSGNSWHRGIVTDVVEATSTLAVRLEDGRDKTLELGKQGVRFVSQKQKRSKV